MKKLILIIFVLYTATTNAQIFAPQGAQWNYKYTPYGGSNIWQLRTYNYTGDTVINGISCSKIVEYTDVNGYYTNYFYSDSNRIFYYNKQYNFFNKLFDYTLNFGDSIPIYRVYETEDSLYYTRIIDKGIETIEGKEYRWIEYYTPTGPQGTFFRYFHGRYYEKLGFKDRFFVPENEEGLSFDAGYHACLYSYNDDVDSLPHYNNFIVCNLPLGVEENKTEQFSIFPNPIIDGKFTIQSPTQIKSVQLTNMLGQTVLTIALNGNEVNIGSLSQGIYVAKITFANGKEIHQRVLIE